MKKIYLSADIEGTCGIADWKETELGDAQSSYFRTQMTKEVAAACRGALLSGASEILVKDAHSSGRNIDPSALPEEVRILRSWTRDPLVMMGGSRPEFRWGSFHRIPFRRGYGRQSARPHHEWRQRMGSRQRRTCERIPHQCLYRGLLWCSCLFPLGRRSPLRARRIHGLGHQNRSREQRNRKRFRVGASGSRATHDLRFGRCGRGLASRKRGRRRCPIVSASKSVSRNIIWPYRASFFPGAKKKGSHEVEYRSKSWNDILIFPFLRTLKASPMHAEAKVHALKHGDRISLIAPSGAAADPDRAVSAVRALRSLGVRCSRRSGLHAGIRISRWFRCAEGLRFPGGLRGSRNARRRVSERRLRHSANA